MTLKISTKQKVKIKIVNFFKYKIKCFFGFHKYYRVLDSKGERIECVECGKIKKVIKNN